jgi:hypothetical protein
MRNIIKNQNKKIQNQMKKNVVIEKKKMMKNEIEVVTKIMIMIYFNNICNNIIYLYFFILKESKWYQSLENHNIIQHFTLSFSILLYIYINLYIFYLIKFPPIGDFGISFRSKKYCFCKMKFSIICLILSLEYI